MSGTQELSAADKVVQAEIIAIAEGVLDAPVWQSFLGVDKSTWSKWGSGERTMPMPRILAILRRLKYRHPEEAARISNVIAREGGAECRTLAPEPTVDPLPRLRMKVQAETGDLARAGYEASAPDGEGGVDETTTEALRELKEAREAQKAIEQHIAALEAKVALNPPGVAQLRLVEGAR